jgi:flavin-dependent dehydrogenase
MPSSSGSVVVVGGGPVGLATSIAARERGFEVRVIDARLPPIDKACGEGIMPDGVRWLDDNGVRVAATESFRLQGISYLDGGTVAQARFATGYGLGVRRTVLHQALVDRAEELGVELDWGVRALSLETGGLETTRGRLDADWIVAADGLKSQLRRWAGLEAADGSHRRRVGIRRHYQVEPWSDQVEVYWADDCEAYVTPVSVSAVGIAILWNDRGRRFDEGLKRFADLADRLRGHRPASTDRGNGPLWRQASAVRRGRLALVGDAAGYLDAITGEGLSLGFHEADALADAFEAGDLELYERAVKDLVALPFAMIRLLLFAERHPAIRRRMVATLAREPELFARFLAIHTRDRPPSSLGLGGALRLVRGLVWA